METNGMGKLSKWSDTLFNKILPKKFVVFILATILAVTGVITGEHWFYISLAYVGGNVLGKVAGAINGKKNS